MNNFLLEILVEEIPARFQQNTVEEFKKIIITEFEKYKICYENARTYISPRRIVFSADIRSEIFEFIEKKKGPQITAPQSVIDKFLQANNVNVNESFEQECGKKKFVFVDIKHPAKQTVQMLPNIIKKAITELPWPKSMRWNEYAFYFVRPLQNILAIYNNEKIPFYFDEINLFSTDYTVGHRFMSPQKIYTLNINDYMQKMENAFVVVGHDERKKIIIEEIKNIEKLYQITVDLNNNLLDEIVGLVEYPVVLFGKISDKFMHLPEEVIVTPMRVHQRYFPTRKDKNLAPYFVFVANILAGDGGKNITIGNERVLNARLEDALFFFDKDLKIPLETYLEKLKKIVFNEKLGTLFDRVKRIKKTCEYICDDLQQKSLITKEQSNKLQQICMLAKCDLATTMVCEFPELQGIIGGYYSEIQGEDIEISRAIFEQYKSVDDISSLISALYSIADKMEIITSFFAIGKEPTGSKDPFALRRAAIGLIKIIKKYNISIDLKCIVTKIFALLKSQNLICDSENEIIQKIMNFISERLKIVLKELNIPQNIIESVMLCNSNILSIYNKSIVLAEIFETDSGARLLSVYRRAKNIIDSNIDVSVNENLLTEIEEKNLFIAINKFEYDLKNSGNINDESIQFKTQMHICIAIEKNISSFFEKILVNTENEEIKQNRLNLLTKFVAVFASLKMSDFFEMK